jgi:hypothetical protein
MIYPSDPEQEVEVVLQADKSAFKAKKVGVPTPINSATSPTANGKKGGSRAGSPAAPGQAQRMRKETDADQIDFNKKILHMSWHPFEDSIAIAATNNVSPDLGENSHWDQFRSADTRYRSSSFPLCRGMLNVYMPERRLYESFMRRFCQACCAAALGMAPA